MHSRRACYNKLTLEKLRTSTQFLMPETTKPKEITSDAPSFTLIELLVVIAIIGILSSVVLAALSSARSSARDATRIQKIDQIRTALEMYYNDHGHYPKPPDVKYMNFSENGRDHLCGPSEEWCHDPSDGDLELETVLSPYIDSLPRAGPGTEGRYGIVYKHHRSDDMYGLGAYLESPTEASKNDGDVNDPRGNHYYSVGALPLYCAEKYSGTGARWWSWNTQNCNEGN